MELYRKYQPKDFGEFVGNEKVVGQVKGLIEDATFDRGAFWFEGDTGTGKTTLAKIIANRFGAKVVELNGRRCNAEAVQQIEKDMQPSPLFGCQRWQAFVIDEAHAMTRPAIQEWLTVLEHLPEKTLIIFTTTENLYKSRSKEDGIFAEFTHPFASRLFCHKLSNQGLAEAFARRAYEIATTEGKNGKTFESYLNTVKECGNNLREVLMRVQQGRI